MKAIVVISGVETAVEITSNGAAGRDVLIDGVASHAELIECEPGVYSVLIEGGSFEVALEGDHAVWVGPHRRELELRDPRRWTRGGGADSADGPQTLKAAMPGKVVRTLVGAGDTVETGQALLVVEAMKMQNEVKSPKAGVVRSLHVSQGDSVAAGQSLAVVE